MKGLSKSNTGLVRTCVALVFVAVIVGLMVIQGCGNGTSRTTSSGNVKEKAETADINSNTQEEEKTEADRPSYPFQYPGKYVSQSSSSNIQLNSDWTFVANTTSFPCTGTFKEVEDPAYDLYECSADEGTFLSLTTFQFALYNNGEYIQTLDDLETKWYKE